MLDRYRSNSNTEIQSEIINGFQGEFYRMVVKAFESKNDSAVDELYEFITKKIIESYDAHNISVYYRFLKVPIWLYEKTINDNNHYYPYCAIEVPKFYKTLFNYRLIVSFKYSNEFSNKKEFNDFLYYGYTAYLYLFYRMSFHQKYDDLNNSIKDFRKLLIDRERIDYNTKYKIRDLIKQKQYSNANDLKEKYNIDYYSDVLYYHSLLCIQSWLYYLYSENKVNEDVILKLTNSIELSYDHGEELINDATFIREQSHWEYLEISGWDDTERTEMEAYSPPQPHQWITFGFTIMLLRQADITNLDLDLINDDVSASMLLGEITSNLRFIENNIEKWKEIILCYNNDDFDLKRRSIENIFMQLKRRHQALEEEKNASLELSKALINKFKEITAKSWNQGSKLKKLFTAFKNIDIQFDKERRYESISQTIFFERAKTMFTEENHQHIYGTEDFGANFGREYFDSYIFSSLIKNSHINKFTSVNECLGIMTNSMKKRGFEPDVIIMPPEYLQNKELIENPLFTQRWQIKGDVPNEVIGIYDKIYIYHTFTNRMKNKILICNFSKAFQLEILHYNDSVPEDLAISVNSLNNEDAENEYSSRQAKWKTDKDGNVLTKDEAINLIKTAVKIKFEVNINLIMANPELYEICEIIHNDV